MNNKRDRPKQKKAFSLKKSFESLKQKLKNLKPKKAKATKKQNASKFGKVNFNKAISGILVVFIFVAIIGVFGNIGGTNTVVKNKKPTNSDNDSLDINGVVRQYKVNAGATVNAGDFVEFVQKWDRNSVTEANPSIMKAVSLSYDTIMVVYVSLNAIRYSVVTLGENQVNRVFEGDVYRDETKVFTHLDVDVINSTDIVIGYTASISGGESSSETMCFVARFDNHYSTVNIGGRYGYPTKREGFRVCCLKEGRIAVTYYNDSATGIYENVLVFFYNTDTLDFETGFSSRSSTKINDPEQLNIYKLDELHFVQLALLDNFSGSDTTAIQLFTVTDSEVVEGEWIDLGIDIKSSLIVRESETSWLIVGTYVYRVMFVDGAFSVSSRLFGANEGIAAIIANERLNILKESGEIFSYSLADPTNDVTITDLAEVKTGYFFPCNAENLFVSITSNANVLLRGFTVADDGTITQNEMENTGLFVQKAITKFCPIGIAKTSGKEGDIIEVYCVE